MVSRRARLFFVLLSLPVVVFCSRDSSRDIGDTRRVVDDLGESVSVSYPPERIISLAPNITEMVCFLGESHRLIGVTTQCDWPEEISLLPRVGEFSNPNIELIVSLSPDLVLTTSVEQRHWNRRLSSLGIPVYSVYPRTCDELVESMRGLLDLFGDPDEGRDSLAAFTRRLEEFGESGVGAGDTAPRVYVEISDRPLMTAGRGSFVDDLIVRAGGVNVAGFLERDYSVINQERVIEADPDVIFVFHNLSAAEDIARRIGWEDVKAVRKGRVYDDIDLDLVLRPGPRVIRGLRLLREKLHESS